MKVSFDGVEMARIRVSNSADETRRYEIKAEAEIQQGFASSVLSGTVVKDGMQVADFSSYGTEACNVNIYSVGDRTERFEIYDAVETFVGDVREKARNEEVLKF